jgi:hypothetical protein
MRAKGNSYTDEHGFTRINHSKSVFIRVHPCMMFFCAL